MCSYPLCMGKGVRGLFRDGCGSGRWWLRAIVTVIPRVNFDYLIYTVVSKLWTDDGRHSLRARNLVVRGRQKLWVVSFCAPPNKYDSPAPHSHLEFRPARKI